jgi:hypothetical protein
MEIRLCSPFNHHRLLTRKLSINMTRRKPLSDDLWGVILNMGMSQSISNIVKLTGLKKRTIERIFANYRNKGTVMREHMYQELRGRKRSLTVRDTKVCDNISSGLGS